METQAPHLAIAAVILAGGHSSRMGRDKALINIEGQTLLQRVYAVAEACSSVVYVITPWQDRYQPLLPSHCHFIVESRGEGELPPGPLMGFAQSLSLIKADWILVLACDLPNLDIEVLQDWRSHLPTLPPDVMAFLPRQAKGWDPLCGFYRSSCLSSLQRFIDQGGRSFQRWLETQLVRPAPLPDHALMLFNCNSPQDLQRYDELRSNV